MVRTDDTMSNDGDGFVLIDVVAQIVGRLSTVLLGHNDRQRS